MLNIIIVSHGTLWDIKKILSEISENKNCNFWIRDNLADPNLAAICKEYQVNYSRGLRPEGFALNNNIIAEEVISNAMKKGGLSGKYLLFMNPDAFITNKELTRLIDILKVSKPDMFTIDLYKDDNYTIRDPAIRKFPTLMTFISSFFFNKNPTILDRDKLSYESSIDWCASSFFGITIESFITLKGFDSKFFMYCEDVDICYRAKKLGLKLRYFPEVVGIHRANHESKTLYSRNFVWHLKSAIRYLWRRHHDK